MGNRTPVERIRTLLSFLPSGDIEIGKEFLDKRDFESLQLLINSAIIRVKRGLTKEIVKEEYLKVDLEELSKLKLEVDTYCMALELPKQEDNFDNFDDENFNEEYY